MYLNSFLLVLVGFRILLMDRFHANICCISHFYTSSTEHFKICKMVHLSSQGDWSRMLNSLTALGLLLPMKMEEGKCQTHVHKCSLPEAIRLSPLWKEILLLLQSSWECGNTDQEQLEMSWSTLCKNISYNFKKIPKVSTL